MIFQKISQLKITLQTRLKHIEKTKDKFFFFSTIHYKYIKKTEIKIKFLFSKSIKTH